MGLSFGPFTGVSKKNVLDDADLAKFTTFTKFYLKDDNENVLNL